MDETTTITTKQILDKLDKLGERLARIETRLCVFMEAKGVEPRIDKKPEEVKKSGRSALTSGIFSQEWW